MKMVNCVDPVFVKFIHVADAIVATFGSSCEVIIHDLRNLESSVVYLKGNITGRKLGAPTTDLILKELRHKGNRTNDMLGFLTRTKDGKFLKSSITFIRDINNQIIGCLGINFDISNIALAHNTLGELIATEEVEKFNTPREENYAQNVSEVIERIIEDSLEEMDIPVVNMKKDDKLYFVKLLDKKGFFLVQGSIDRVCEILQVSKQTIYNYFEDIRAGESNKKIEVN